MSDFSLIYPTTLQFKVTRIETVPENYYDAKSWEHGVGVYFHDDNNCLYFVGKYGVNTIYNPMEQRLFDIIDDPHYSPPKVEEDLLLRAIAAMNGHRI
jgi:hypothetical protein